MQLCGIEMFLSISITDTNSKLVFAMQNFLFNKSNRKGIRQGYQKNIQSDGSSPPRLRKTPKEHGG